MDIIKMFAHIEVEWLEGEKGLNTLHKEQHSM